MRANQVFGYREVCEGFSVGEFQGEKIKFLHQSLFDQCLIEEERYKNVRWAGSHGYNSKEEALKKAIAKGEWSEERERGYNLKIQDYRDMWARRDKISPIGLVQNVRGFHQTLREILKEIDEDRLQRAIVTPECQESYANSRAFDYEIELMSRKMDGSPFFGEDEFDSLGDASLVILRNEYSDKILKFNNAYFEKMAIADFFYSIFDNFAANPGDFFKKPGPELTVFQLDLLKAAKRYHEVMKIAWDAPEDFFDEPKMLETYAIVKNRGGHDSDVSSAADIEQDIAKFKSKRN